MIPQLEYIIGEQNFELIRNRIGEILTYELRNQANLTGKQSLKDVKVWIERVTPFDNTELPAVNIYYNDTLYNGSTVVNQQGQNTYHIDVLTKSKNSGSQQNDSDKQSYTLAANLLGIVRAILHAPQYVRLNFDGGVVTHREVSEIRMGKISNQETTSTGGGRLLLKVNANEFTEEIKALEACKYTTVVTLEETEKGFYYELKNS